MKTSNPLLKLCGVLSDERCEGGEDSPLPGVEWIVDIFTRYMIKPQLANSYTREEDNFFADIS